MSRVLVTGGAGFIGSHLVEALLRGGYQVTVADDLSQGRKSYVPKAASFRKIDVRTAAFRDLIKDIRPEYVCHLAAQRSAVNSRINPGRDADINIIGTVNALVAAAQPGLKKFLFVSSAAVYGLARDLPTPEQAELQLSSPYAVSKYAAEQYVNYYDSSGQLPAVIVRLSNVYGPRQDASSEGGVVAKFAAALVAGSSLTIEGRGEQTRDFLYVTDAAQGLMAALLTGRGLYNLATTQEISIRELAVKMGEVAGTVPHVSYLPLRPDDISRSALSPAKASRDLGWRAETPLTDGLRQTLKWYKELS
ncbi:MAG: NAD-dependent epimerase/dehydratase [Parcubacteria group bacterium GW2011_GWD2_43_10]|uniref:NAD-dependent epimerase/dehydratase domain-containing protein n=4 Tax=Candidatus Vebleniibacteriota TaxID=1817921 RepID=A0A1G2Q7N4_9BACT|nr:MAG: NAD-dependent epimerase/dehydratase [Parcubacteria group bacterium GW2011_GWA2_42_80]KKS79543.1 MAG: NAD-dependent epimerase/dehydratase [Parcubacteria group bacterium GW2011_GWD1_42_9]KKS82906.1 MAG: NAD-dependent epimerase/dehydratase [Parcubacteria group bacterium GW2011_GWD2_43_10]KKS92815.1 MAG: NAD-dependent epimerase/dehydratase [Parcubacteria group bacterium GW2011_GWE2_43_12]KKT12317.1 MAG: NAD-dependent epimerase/dehydratase [Parcubacteria group bacterium GW2011_GWA1_43_27]KK